MIRAALLRRSRAVIPTLSRATSLSPLHIYPQPPVARTSPRRIASSWYSTVSTAAEAEVPGAANTAGEPAVQTPSSAQEEAKAQAKQGEDAASKELEAKNREIIDLKDKYLRSVADFRNLQDRTKRDVEAARSFAIQRFAKDLIDSVDNLDRALTTVPPESLVPKDDDSPSHHATRDLINLYDGLKMTESILMQTLKKHGLERFDPAVQGERFDPNLHEATFQAPVQGKEDGTVFHTQQKGFVLNGRVLRAAKVGIVKNPPS